MIQEAEARAAARSKADAEGQPGPRGLRRDGAGLAAATRRVKRLAWLLVYALSAGWVKVLHLMARYLALGRGVVRRRLAKPLQSLASHALANARRLPAPGNPSITIMEVQTVTKDGVTLHGTVYLPVEPDHDAREHGPEKLEAHHKFPTILVRTPYGRFNLGPVWAQIFAERGFAVLLQDTRGRFGSGGDFFPIKDEIKDGADTIEWIREQAWCNGKVALYGVSYLGLTAYAAAGGAAGHHVDAMVPVMTSSETYSLLFHAKGGSLALDLVLRWLWLAVKLMDTVHIYKFWVPGFQTELDTAFMSAPLKNQDQLLMGQKLGFLQEALRATDGNHEFWKDKNTLCDMSNAERRPPAHIVAGWYDFFNKQSFVDFGKAHAAGGSTCKLTVGGWRHWDFAAYGSPSIKIALEFFNKELCGVPGQDDDEEANEADASAIHVAVLGTSPTRWLGFQAWPPACACAYAYPIGSMRSGPQHPQENAAPGYSSYTYDPANPTPYVGGPSFDPHNSGRVEQARLESRPDVLTFTAATVTRSMYVCGDVFVELHARSSNPHTDFFFKLCEVEEATGNSYNLVEGLTRLSPGEWTGEEVDEAGQCWHVVRRAIKVGPIATLFRPGMAVRLQVSGGAHPLYMRNFGTGHDIADAVELRKADHRVYHDTQLLLPVVDERDVDAHTMSHPAYPEDVVLHSHP